MIYARQDDNYIPLDERAEVANQSQADLFVYRYTPTTAICLQPAEWKLTHQHLLGSRIERCWHQRCRCPLRRRDAEECLDASLFAAASTTVSSSRAGSRSSVQRSSYGHCRFRIPRAAGSWHQGKLASSLLHGKLDARHSRRGYRSTRQFDRRTDSFAATSTATDRRSLYKGIARYDARSRRSEAG